MFPNLHLFTVALATFSLLFGGDDDNDNEGKMLSSVLLCDYKFYHSVACVTWK